MKFSLFFSFFCLSNPNSPSEFVRDWKRIEFCISSFPSSTLRTNFSSGKFSFYQRAIHLQKLNFLHFSVSCAIETQILYLNLWQFEKELNSASSPSLPLLWGRSFDKKNFNFMRGQFVCRNYIFLIFQFLLPFTPKLSIWICDRLKANGILHLLLFFFPFQDQFFSRKIFILSKGNSSAEIKFSLFFSFFGVWDPNSRFEFVTVWNRIQFCISSLCSSTLTKNFS